MKHIKPTIIICEGKRLKVVFFRDFGDFDASILGEWFFVHYEYRVGVHKLNFLLGEKHP